MTSIVVVAALLLVGPHAKAQKSSPVEAVSARYHISGTVVDANTDEPVGGARLSIVEAGDSVDTTADADGHFSFDGLLPGTYSLSATAQGYVSARYDQHGQFSTGIVVGNGLDSEHIVFRLPPQGVIYGTVTDERGDAVRNAQVMLFELQPTGGSRRPFRRGGAQTNDLGQYRIAHLNEGSYYVAVQARPWYAEPGFTHQPDRRPSTSFGMLVPKSDALLDVVYPVTFFPGVTDPAAANVLHITPGDQEEADIQLTPVPSAHVLITGLPPDQPNGPVSYPAVRADERVFGEPMGISAPVQQREIAPGTWEVDGVPPGQVTLSLENARISGSSEQMLATNVSDGDTIDVGSAPATATVTGRVILPAALGPSEQARVLLASEEQRQTFSAPIGKDGQFAFAPLRLGTYRVHLWLSGTQHGQYLRDVSATGAQVSGHVITIAAADKVGLTLTVGVGVGVVNGVAQLAGKPAAGVMILLVPASGQNILEDSRRDQSDSDGTFTLPNVVPGKYVLMAIENGWGLDWTDPAVLKPYRDRGQVVEVAPGETRKVIISVEPLLK